MNNTVKTVFLLTLLTLLLMTCGQLLAGARGMTAALIFAVIMNFSCYWFSDRIVLSLYRAQPLSSEEAPAVHRIVRDLASQKNMPVPRIYLIPSASPNAFATGRNPEHAVVAVTQGILEWLDEDELRGVLAHELAHVVHRDILTSSIVATLAGAIGFLASMARWSVFFGGRRGGGGRQSNPLVLLLMAILMPLAAALIQMAISRSREYHADEEGGALCGNPLYLATALKKIDTASRKIPMRDAQPASAHLFIANPLSGREFAGLFMTHPPVEERIARLEEMARARGL